MNIKKISTIFGMAVMIFCANGQKNNNIAANATSSQTTNSYKELNLNETKSRLNALSITASTYSTFYRNYGKLPGYYEYKKNNVTIVSMYRLETNLKYAYTEFTGYAFKYSKEVASTSIYLSNFTSQTIKVSSAVGVYASTSFGVSTRFEETIGASATYKHNIKIDRTFTLNNMENGYYGLMMDFNTCDRLYLKFVDNKLSGSILSINNPSSSSEFYFSKRSV